MSGSGRRGIAGALASLAGAQALVAGAALIRLPFVIDALGTDGFGAYVLVGNVAPFLLVATAGARVSSRALVAEHGGAGADQARTGFAHALGAARALRTVELLVGLPLAVGAGLAFGSSLVSSKEDLVVVLVVTVLLCAISVPGGVAWGKLEADGRQTLVHSLLGAVAAVGLAVTVAVAHLWPSFTALSIVNVVTTTAPFLLAALLVRRGAPAPTPAWSHETRPALRATAHATARAVPPLGARAMDPFLVTPTLGTEATAVYGLGQRMSLVNTLAIQATAPIVASDLAKRRGAGRAMALAGVRKMVLAQALASAVCGLGLLVVGPWVGHLLSGGDIDVPRSLLLAFAVAGITFSASEACALAATGPRGLAVGWRIDGLGLVVNIALSLALLGPFGVSGPVWGSAAASAVTLVLWAALLHRRADLLLETHRSRAPAATGGTP